MNIVLTELLLKLYSSGQFYEPDFFKSYHLRCCIVKKNFEKFKIKK